MTLSRKACRYSRIVAYCLILASVLALFNASVQTVSSQTFDTPTGTENSTETAQTTTTTNVTQVQSTSTETAQTTTTATSTATRYAIAYATSNLYVTIFQVQYTTTNNLFTIVDVQFTTITSYVTQVDSPQPVGAPSLPIHSSSGAPIVADPLPGQIDVGLTLQLIAASLILIILLASIPLIRRERK